jgi:hypothetical protein
MFETFVPEYSDDDYWVVRKIDDWIRSAMAVRNAMLQGRLPTPVDQNQISNLNADRHYLKQCVERADRHIDLVKAHEFWRLALQWSRGSRPNADAVQGTFALAEQTLLELRGDIEHEYLTGDFQRREWVTLSQAAARVGFDVETLRRLGKSRKLPEPVVRRAKWQGHLYDWLDMERCLELLFPRKNPRRTKKFRP